MAEANGLRKTPAEKTRVADIKGRGKGKEKLSVTSQNAKTQEAKMQEEVFVLTLESYLWP